MLISKTAIVKWNSKIKKHYVNLGYKFTKMGDEFEVDIKDLTNGSASKVLIQCDYCGKIYDVKWQTYINKLSQSVISKSACKDCCELKAQDAIESIYGGYKNLFQETNTKRISTNIQKFGCENPFGNKDVQDKIKNYYIDTFGVTHSMQIPSCVQKSKQTCIEKYGVDNYSKTIEWRESHRGENSPVWKGYNATTVRDGRELPEYRDWRKAVFCRDLYTCKCCGARNGNGKYIRLEAHHIKNWKDNLDCRYDINNGITLCVECHLSFHSMFGKKNNTEEQLKHFIEENNKNR